MSISDINSAMQRDRTRSLSGKKFVIDYFQREYRWQAQHIRTLIDDLTNAFLSSFRDGDERMAVAQYTGYYLGSVVFCNKGDSLSIVDGQQRITSLTLLLIYLRHRLSKEDIEEVKDLIYSKQYGESSFNMADPSRKSCMQALLDEGDYSAADGDDETTINLAERYEDIKDVFPETITDAMIPHFIDWLKLHVKLVEITAFSDENAYLIFETMNNRGLSLTPTDLLKGYVLSKIDENKRDEINALWKIKIQELHSCNDKADLEFFPAWFRAKFAQTQRERKGGSANMDYERIATSYHSWFREKAESLLKLKNSTDYYEFFKYEFPYYVDKYVAIFSASNTFDEKLKHIYYITQLGFAPSLKYMLLLAPLNRLNESNENENSKFDLVARFIESFIVRRKVNYKQYGASVVNYTMFITLKKIRNNTLSDLRDNLKHLMLDLDEEWDGVDRLELNGMNKLFVKHLLSRITVFVNELTGDYNTNYDAYMHPSGTPFEIEHIWANKFEEHKDEFDQENEFSSWRNSVGALLLLPKNKNGSYNDDPYESKLKHYVKENTYAQTLTSAFYEKNPSFLNNPIAISLKFTPHSQFKKADILSRQSLVRRICEKIWSLTCFDEIDENQQQTTTPA
jgi:uncharacterized protein with ParB-like and HNH nuclease domain